MAISVQANTAQPLPQNAAQMLAQALRSGQVVEARIVGGGASGTTQLAIGGQLVDAALPVPLQPGTLIHLLVQGSGHNARLTVLLQTTPTPTPAPAPQPHPQPGQTPQAIPPQAHSVQTPSINGQVNAQQAPALPQSPPQLLHAQTQAPQPIADTTAARLQGQAQQALAQNVSANARPVLVTSPVPLGVPAKGPVAQPQAVQAVAAAIRSRVPQIEPGTVLRVQLSGTGPNARPVLVPVATPGGVAAKAQGQVQHQQTLPALVPNPVQQALTQTIQQSVARQDSITTLLTSLAGFGAKLADLPKPVAQAGTQVLAGRLNLNTRPLDGAGLKAALTRSGVLFESALLHGGTKALPQGDLKGALLTLRNVLTALLGKGEAGKAVSQQSALPPPPTSRTHPRAGRPVSLPLMSAAPNAATPAKLLGQNEAALARMRLVQISSLPEAVARPGQGPSGTAPEMNIELPLMFGGELSVGQFQIFKDGSGGANGDGSGEWKMRFSINFSQTGEVGATVSLRGGKTGVMLWAEREETAAVLQEMAGELADSLSARGLEPGFIRCRHGHSPQAQKPVGAFMDNCS
ncbi:MAG: flagellar hook-length control protein FliK [Alphaproteobacteria bacterium]